jgi:hypothetical protein
MEVVGGDFLNKFLERFCEALGDAPNAVREESTLARDVQAPMPSFEPPCTWGVEITPGPPAQTMTHHRIARQDQLRRLCPRWILSWVSSMATSDEVVG